MGGQTEVEGLVIDRGFWCGKRVFVTGHTGFKGSWTCLLLGALGAEVSGLALEPEHAEDIFNAAGVADGVTHRIGDIRDRKTVEDAMGASDPDIVLHMAAQALVRRSYADPVGTYATNVMGSVHVLEAARRAPRLKALVVVTSDKCYENTGALWGYRETDAMGGYDPYSNSKGCAELVTAAYRQSFFGAPEGALIGSGRAGNVIGGGDWSADRLVPDAIRAFRSGKTVEIRNPAAVRPWQHVLDPVLGYLVLAERLAKGDGSKASGWNFGPAPESEVPVCVVINGLARFWGGEAGWKHVVGDHPHEAGYLKLDCTKARSLLGWSPLLPFEAALETTVEWYRAQAQGEDMRAVTLRQIETVLARAVMD